MILVLVPYLGSDSLVAVGVGVGGDGGALGLSHGRAVVDTLTAGHTACGVSDGVLDSVSE
eukprot:COSAG05_NODE_152_length_15898_cov_21.995000_16_plen_60_part_00